MVEFITPRIVDSILGCDLMTKRKLGQRLAKHLRLKEGEAGSDDGIDGVAEVDGNLIIFQSKLEDRPLGPDKAKIFIADIFRHGAHIGIYLAGRGYTGKFEEVASQLMTKLGAYGYRIKLFLLTLQDVFDHTEVMRNASKVFPPLSSIGDKLSDEG